MNCVEGKKRIGGRTTEERTGHEEESDGEERRGRPEERSTLKSSLQLNISLAFDSLPGLSLQLSQLPHRPFLISASPISLFSSPTVAPSLHRDAGGFVYSFVSTSYISFDSLEPIPARNDHSDSPSVDISHSLSVLFLYR